MNRSVQPIGDQEDERQCPSLEIASWRIVASDEKKRLNALALPD